MRLNPDIPLPVGFMPRLGPDPEFGFGILDTKDGVWLGNDVGPFAFIDETLALVVAEIAGAQQPVDAPPLASLFRFIVVPHPMEPAMRKRDNLQTRKTFQDTLAELEREI